MGDNYGTGAVWQLQRKGQMADWIFQGSPREHDLDARIAASPEQWWGPPRGW
jgi:hypothetical protein